MTTVDDVLQHLLFHRALAADDEDGALLARYAALVEGMERGIHLTTGDPLERGVAALFELVIQQQMDPWSIDLVEFCRLYMEKVRAEGSVHFVTAGRLVFMAWSILRLQSEGILDAAAPPPPEEPGLGGWEMEPIFYQPPEDEAYTFAVLGAPEPPLRPAPRRAAVRPVTLVDLLRAFEEARREAIAGRRPAAPDGRSLEAKVHGEDLGEEIAWAWDRLRAAGREEVALSEVWPGDRAAAAALFVALLFLARLGRVELIQVDMPRGEILVHLRQGNGQEADPAPLAPAPEEAAA